MAVSTRSAFRVLVALACLVPVASTARASEPAASRADLAAELELRRELGLRTDETFLHLLRDRKRQGHDVHETTVGIPLSDEEQSELVVRDEIGRHDARATRALFAGRDDFGGLFVDNERGGLLHVLATGDPAEVAASLRPRLRHPDRLLVTKATHTYDELVAAQTAVEAQASRLRAQGVHIVTIGIDEPGNSVEVGVTEDTPANRGAVSAAAGEHLPLTFVQRGPIALAGGNVQNSLPFRGGQSIRDGSHSAPQYDCSIGFVGYQTVSLTQQDSAVMTAGHCGFSGQPWYQYNQYIGLSTTNTWPRTSGTTTADAMRIPVTQGMSNDFLAANGAVYNISGWEGQYEGTVGQTVCNNGASSYRVCGVLESNNVTGYTRDLMTGAEVWTYYLRVASAPVKGGDSGGPVTHTAGLHYASGIVQGGVLVNGTEHLAYVHIYNALRALNLTGLYTS